MRFTYIASDTTAGNATTLGASDQDVLVKKIVFGAPADGKILILYDKTTAYGSANGIGSVDAGSVALKFTQPTAAAGKDYTKFLDFGLGKGEGLRLNGGAVHTDGSQVTVCWVTSDDEE